MLHKTSSIDGFHIEGTGGGIGQVDDFFGSSASSVYAGLWRKKSACGRIRTTSTE